MISINYRLTQLDSLLFWMLQLKGILHQHIIFHNKYLILIFFEWGVVLTIFHKPHQLDKMIKKFNLIFFNIVLIVAKKSSLVCSMTSAALSSVSQCTMAQAVEIRPSKFSKYKIDTRACFDQTRWFFWKWYRTHKK